MNQLYVLTDNKASPAPEHVYESELALQTIVTENPHLLLGSNSTGKKLFLLQPEFTLPEYEGSSNSFSLDHLMVDSNGIPALVEVKRSKDTRIRREVVAQMIDYAARMRSVDVDSLRTLFQDNNPEDEASEYFNSDSFWEKVSANLKADRMNLYFVADEIPPSLVTMMDFMRRTMSGIAVYGVEIKEYQSEGTVLLSSSLIGGYEPESIKIDAPTIQWDADSFAEQMGCLNDEALVDVATDIQNSCIDLGYTIRFGSGIKSPSFRGRIGGITAFQVSVTPFNNPPKCGIEICLPALQRVLGHDSDEKLRSMFNDFPDREDAIKRGDIRNTSQYLYYNLAYFEDSGRRMVLLTKLLKIQGELAKECATP